MKLTRQNVINSICAALSGNVDDRACEKINALAVLYNELPDEAHINQLRGISFKSAIGDKIADVHWAIETAEDHSAAYIRFASEETMRKLKELAKLSDQKGVFMHKHRIMQDIHSIAEDYKSLGYKVLEVAIEISIDVDKKDAICADVYGQVQNDRSLDAYIDVQLKEGDGDPVLCIYLPNDPQLMQSVVKFIANNEEHTEGFNSVISVSQIAPLIPGHKNERDFIAHMNRRAAMGKGMDEPPEPSM